MKKLLLGFALMGLFVTGTAQVKTPQASPFSKTEQVVGLTNVEIEYSRPGVKGRTIYGDLVPFGKHWRTGANANTIIGFNNDVEINGKKLAAGKYALFTTPKADSWDVIFYNDTNNWGLPQKWDDAKVALTTTVKPVALSGSVETFTIEVSNITNNSATLDLVWEKTRVSVPFNVPTQDLAMASIEKTLAGPSMSDYFSAAQYYYQSDKDMKKALLWINNAVSMTPAGKDTPFWYLRLKSLIQAKLGDKKGAIETAKYSLEGAKKAGNADYEKMNKDSIAEWSK